jgi:3-hydroxyisobutyrate dehydrogenase-like beta-hydroxyacid dehydrogenase
VGGICFVVIVGNRKRLKKKSRDRVCAFDTIETATTRSFAGQSNDKGAFSHENPALGASKAAQTRSTPFLHGGFADEFSGSEIRERNDPALRFSGYVVSWLS